MDKNLPVKVDQSFADNLLNQFMELWVNPEIQARKDGGKLPQNFILDKAQVLFCLGSPPIVRLNEEVKIQVKVRVNRTVKKGELVYAKDISEIAELKNVDEEQDFAFLILIKLAGKMYMAFNFEHNVTKSKQYLSLGASFLESAKRELEYSNVRQMVELLLVAAENLVKARIYLVPDQKIRKVKTHGGTQQIVNLYAKSGKIIKPDQKDAFNRLIALRDSARYDLSFALEHTKAQTLMSTVESFAQEITTILGHA